MTSNYMGDAADLADVMPDDDSVVIEPTYKIRAGDDGTYVVCANWLDAMKRKDAFMASGYSPQILALRDNGNTYVGKRTYHSDGRITDDGAMH